MSDEPQIDDADLLAVHLNGFASGREYERKQIVAWLRAAIETPMYPDLLANEIEAREHLKD